MFVTFTDALLTAEYGSVRADVEVESSSETGSGGGAIERALEYSNDGLTWTGTAAFDTGSGWLYPTSNAPIRDYGTQFTSISAAYRFFRIGCIGQNRTGGTEVQALLVTMTTELVPR